MVTGDSKRLGATGHDTLPSLTPVFDSVEAGGSGCPTRSMSPPSA